MRRFALLVLVWIVCCVPGMASADQVLKVGSKRFTESYILGEILVQAAAPVAKAEHRQGLGNTAIVLSALQSGAIDVYPEYLGTIDLEILKNARPTSLAAMREQLRPLGLGVGVPLGFSNGYALATRGDSGIAALSGLAAKPAFKLGLSHEFIGRGDGWPGLAARYGLPQTPRGIDHGIAYEALQQKQVDVIDIYTTDARIRQYGLRVLDDDKHYFPRYDAVLLYRLDLPQRMPAAWHALQGLEGRINADAMIAMNAQAELDRKPFAAIARDWLAGRADRTSTQRDGLLAKTFGNGFGQLARQHLLLVLVAVLLGCAAGIPLGVLAALAPRLRQPVLAVAGTLQTVPSLALLAILIPLLGRIGMVPALVALCAYALLPIVRNTCTGLLQVPAGLRNAALALGLSRRQALLKVELPLAAPVILAGVKTAAVMSVGTATIAAFIGAGGFGERITTGLALNDNDMLLAGAIPAALLALLTQAGFELAERLLTRRLK
ncbi:glycine betaine ABC transporter substrate-binding protein [Massilia aerilata]|uniref:Glycine betaine ABC transporter substrate-binding protein n=1 Tax=Massilia aerilata TaxID=453817 RepID=A0ABW0S440_9BURK